MEKINKYLDIAVEGISDREQREEVRAELEDHIMSKYEEYIARGYSAQEAEERTLNDMGDMYGLREQMGELHSFVPRVYYHRTTLILLISVLFRSMNVNVGDLQLLPTIIGVVLMVIALYRFYPIGKNTKIAFWTYTSWQLLGGVLKICSDAAIILLAAVVGTFLSGAVMTLLCNDLLKKDKGHEGLKWVIGLEWLRTALLTITFFSPTWLEVSVSSSFISVAVELVLLWKFSRRAERYEWPVNRSLEIYIPIAMAAVYAILACVPIYYQIKISDLLPGSTWVPETAAVWTGEKQRHYFVTNGVRVQDILLNINGDPSLEVNNVQLYMDDADYEKLSACAESTLRTSSTTVTESRFMVCAYNEEKMYLIEFFTYTNKAEPGVCRQRFFIEGAVSDVHYRNFYQDDDGKVFTYKSVPYERDGAYYFVLQGKQSFGYVFLETEMKEKYLTFIDKYSEIVFHKTGMFQEGKIDYEHGWEYISRK